MTMARADGLRLLLLGIVVFAVFGAFLQFRASDSMADFKAIYYGTRSVVEGHDPYNSHELSTLYRTEFGEGESEFAREHKAMILTVYFPTAFLLFVPLAMLPLGVASVIWSGLTAISLITSACLVWNIGAEHAPILSGALVGFALVNGAILVGNGNPAGIITGLCLIGVWCLIKDRFAWAGVLCFAVALAIKPQDAGLIWLAFLSAGGMLTRRAMKILILSVLIYVAAFAWGWRTMPQWVPELRTNLVEVSSRGGNSDPGPTGLTAKTGTMEVITDLQTVVSVFRDSPVFYNSVTFLFCGFLLAIWAIAVLRSNSSPISLWLALAVIAPLSLLVTYHRAYDARLLLLCVPACAMLWARRGRIAKLALAFTIAGFVFTGEIPLAVLNTLTRPLHLGTATLPQKIATVALARPATLSLLAMTIFYLWVLVREKRLEIGSLAAVAVGERAVSAGNP